MQHGNMTCVKGHLIGLRNLEDTVHHRHIDDVLESLAAELDGL